MTTITLDKAQQDLPILVQRALAGEEIVIEAPGSLAVKLEPFAVTTPDSRTSARSHRGRGSLKGTLIVGPQFFDPLTDEEVGLAGEAIRE